TGSVPFMPPIEGSSKDNVFALRTFDDANNIVQAVAKVKNVVVIGGGLLGLEAAHAFVKRGLDVTIVEFFDRLLPRQIDNDGALLLTKMLEDMGFKFRLNAKTKAIQGDTFATGVELESGEVLSADIVLMSAGVRPSLNLPEKLGLEIDRGVMVNNQMETRIDKIYAAGDVAQFEQTNFCIWPEAQEQGRVAGSNMAGIIQNFQPVVPSNRLKVAGIDLGSAGDIDPDNILESDIERSDKVYRKLVRKDGTLVGCIMLGNTEGFAGVVKQITIT
ncbi:MAG: NAD(P)/FAD-dependent oxidoreductase, partial [Desulfobacteraceae bacterium]|nr:NAD(P)/FAD-dependent oxidoreductase [Desulfobacteraceae bacterium]